MNENRNSHSKYRSLENNVYFDENNKLQKGINVNSIKGVEKVDDVCNQDELLSTCESGNIFKNHIYVNPQTYFNQQQLEIIYEETENDLSSHNCHFSNSEDSIFLDFKTSQHHYLNKSETEINNHKNDVIKKHCLGTKKNENTNLIDIDFEGILKLIGGCNKWQILIFLIISLHQIPHAMLNLGVVYMMYQPDHWCKLENFTKKNIDNHYLHINEIWNWNTILESGLLYPLIDNDYYKKHNKHDQCNFFVRDSTKIFKMLEQSTVQYSNSSNLTNESISIKRCKSWEYDNSVMEETVVTKFNRVCDDNWSRAHVHLSYSLGYLVGCFVGGYISDRYGRKTTFLTFTVLSTFFAFLLPSTVDFISFLIIRFWLAVCNEAADLAAYILCMEITGVQYRSTVGCILQIPWSSGYVLLALIGYLSRSWVTIQYFTTFLLFISIFFIYYVPESPRWLLVTGKVYEAEIIIRKASQVNNNNLPSDLGLVTHSENAKFLKNKPNFLNLLSISHLAWRNCILFFLWTSAALVYYGLVIVISDQSKPEKIILPGNFFLNNAISGIIEIPTLLFCMYLMRYGRKKSQMIMFAGSGICLFLAMIFILLEEPKTSFIFMLVGKMCIQGAFNILYIFTSELYPTILRNSAVGVSSMVARSGSALSGYIAVAFDITFPIIPMSIFAFLSLSAGLLILLLPETKDLPLPETILDAVTVGRKKNNSVNNKNDVNNNKSKNNIIKTRKFWDKSVNKTYEDLKNNSRMKGKFIEKTDV